MPVDKIAISIPDPDGKKPVASDSLPVRASSHTPLVRSGVVSMPLVRKAQLAGGNAIFTPASFFSPITAPQNWQIAAKRREVSQWCRHWYENEPKVAAGRGFFLPFLMV